MTHVTIDSKASKVSALKKGETVTVKGEIEMETITATSVARTDVTTPVAHRAQANRPPRRARHGRARCGGDPPSARISSGSSARRSARASAGILPGGDRFRIYTITGAFPDDSPMPITD